jgi:hypothetical protein
VRHSVSQRGESLDPYAVVIRSPVPPHHGVPLAWSSLGLEIFSYLDDGIAHAVQAERSPVRRASSMGAAYDVSNVLRHVRRQRDEKLLK